jgi:spermidine synthase
VFSHRWRFQRRPGQSSGTWVVFRKRVDPATEAGFAMGGRAKEQVREFRAAVLLLFTISGAVGLVLEVVWVRILGTVFGNTVYATSTVLTAFMLGLALGSVVLGPVADRSRRPLLLYGCLEIGVALYAMLFLGLVAVSYVIYAWVFRTVQPGLGVLNLVRFPLCLLLLLPPTILMGGTLPVLARHLAVRRQEPGQEVGYLYGANTLGGVAGCFLAGFVLLEAWGVHNSLMAAAATAMGIGSLAVALGRRFPETGEAPEPAEKPGPASPPRRKKSKARDHGQPALKPTQPLSLGEFRLLLVGFGITGFCSLACEVLWTRVLVFLLGSSVYAFATMLTAFLTGIGIGSFVSARFVVPRLRRPLWWFGTVEVLVGLSVLASVLLLARLERIDFRFLEYFTWSGAWRLRLVQYADAFVVLLAPTLLMGAALPIVAAGCLRGSVPVGRRVGQVYAANTVGCVLGSSAAGLLLLPALGTHGSLLLLVGLNLAVGVALLWRVQRSVLGRWAVATPVAAVAVAAFLVVPSDVFYDTINAYHYPSKIAFIKEHPTGTVTVHDVPNGQRLIAVDGINVAGSDFMLRSTQKLQGYIPLCLHPHPKRVVQIGFGSGETARVGLEFGVQDYTVVEICPAVFDAGVYFEEINHGSYRDPRIRKIIMDGKNFARLSAEKFDIVMNDSTYPGTSGSSALYTVDHFRNCRQRLADGGLFSCWVPLDLRPAELRMILRSFREVFPHSSFWVASNCLNKHGLILGSLSRLQIDFARLKAVISRPEVASDLEGIAIHDVYDLLDCHLCDEAAIGELVRDDPVNTDDRPRLEFSCATMVAAEGNLGQVLAMLIEHHAPISPYVSNFIDRQADQAELALRFKATTHVFLAQVAQLMGSAADRTQQLLLAQAANPGESHVASCQQELYREIEDFRSALAGYPLAGGPGNRVLAMRLADRLLMAGHYQMALDKRVDRRYLEAAELYEQLVKVRPPLAPVVFVRLGEIRFRLGQIPAAEKILQECLEFWPESAETHDRLAGIYLQTGRFDLAERHNAEAVRLAPDSARYLQHRRETLRVINGTTPNEPSPR